MATLTEELGKLAAEAIYKRGQQVEEEKSRLRPHLEKEWKKLRSSAVHAAKTGSIYFVGTIDTVACHFKVFKPQPCDVKVSLPDELMAVNKGKDTNVCFVRGSGGLAPVFELRIDFGDSVAKNLATLKRDRAAAENKERGEDAAAKRVKVEQKVKE